MAGKDFIPNPLCERCYLRCKQPKTTVIISCPKFEPIPVQLEIKFTGIKTKRKSLAL